MTDTDICHDGPLVGQTITCRSPRGFIAVNRLSNLVWIYDRTEDGYRVRESYGRTLDLALRVHTALNDPDWDVIAVPDLGMTADLVDEDEDDGIPEGTL